MNNFDCYIPIDIHGPIKTSAKLNVQKHSTNNPAIMFQLFDGPRPLMLDDISKVTIAFTNTNNESVAGSGTLQVVNPHRGTISYVLNSADITLFGIHTITLGITTGDSFFTVQCTLMCQEINDDLYNILAGNDGDSSSGSGSCKVFTYGDDFPCQYYNSYCRLCRRCEWIWYHNTLPKPVCFEEIKMCKNPFVYPPEKNYAVLPGYEKANIPTMVNSDGYVVASIDGVNYVCDIGKDGAVYLADKELTTPAAMIGLYLGPKLTMYYKTSEKVSEDNFDIGSLFP
jgi:hypothetical protein